MLYRPPFHESGYEDELRAVVLGDQPDRGGAARRSKRGDVAMTLKSYGFKELI